MSITSFILVHTPRHSDSFSRKQFNLILVLCNNYRMHKHINALPHGVGVNFLYFYLFFFYYFHANSADKCMLFMFQTPFDDILFLISILSYYYEQCS